jgi:TRAP-type mannitol/chloroaromatic compound transport system permease small subunit
MIFNLIRSIFPCLYRSGVLNGNHIKVSSAPEPAQIIWENVGENPEKRRKLQIINYVLTTFLIGLCFMIIFFIQWGQVAAVDAYGEKSNEGRGISFLSSLFIILLNSIIVEVLKKVSK